MFVSRILSYFLRYTYCVSVFEEVQIFFTFHEKQFESCIANRTKNLLLLFFRENRSDRFLGFISESCGKFSKSLLSVSWRVAYRNLQFTQNFATTCALRVPCNVLLCLRKYSFLALPLKRKSSVAD